MILKIDMVLRVCLRFQSFIITSFRLNWAIRDFICSKSSFFIMSLLLSMFRIEPGLVIHLTWHVPDLYSAKLNDQESLFVLLKTERDRTYICFLDRCPDNHMHKMIYHYLTHRRILFFWCAINPKS